MSSKMRKILVIPVLLLSVCVALIYKQVPVYAQSTEKQQVPIELELHKQNPEENVPFQMVNMFPGDSATQYYRISVSYDKCRTAEFAYVITAGLSTSAGNEYQNKSWIVDFSWAIDESILSDTGVIRVNFEVTPRNDIEKLSKMLELKVRKADTGELIYDGTLADMPIIFQELPIESGNDQSEPSEPEFGNEDDSLTGEGGSSLINPSTGDDSHIMMWLILFIISVAVLIKVIAGHRRSSKAGRKFFGGIFLALCLVLGLGITSAALIYQEVAVEENLFATGQVKISLNDNKPIFSEDMLLEPGMEIRKGFTLRNDSSCDVYYRLYFSNIEGEFADELLVTVLCGENTLFEGTLADLNGEKSDGAVGRLKEGEISNMTIVLKVSQNCGNVVQGSTALFDLNAEAVQAVNNPDGLFE